MKDIVIVSCYPNTEYKEYLLDECVKQLKLLNKDVLIATHYPIPDYIIKKVNFLQISKSRLFKMMISKSGKMIQVMLSIEI